MLSKLYWALISFEVMACSWSSIIRALSFFTASASGLDKMKFSNIWAPSLLFWSNSKSSTNPGNSNYRLTFATMYKAYLDLISYFQLFVISL
jgi:hypothetical protein